MKITKTERGFDLIEFKDRCGDHCSIQKSSAASGERIWMGLHNSPARIYLTQKMVKDLLPYLTNFAATGELT
jgi:hypothetical protein